MSNIDEIYIYSTSDIRLQFDKWASMSTGWSLRRDLKPDNYIWDEDETVRKNKEITAQYNNTIQKEIQKLQNARNDFYNRIMKGVYGYIEERASYEGIKLPQKALEYIWNLAYTVHEDNPSAYLDEIIEYMCKIIDICINKEVE